MVLWQGFFVVVVVAGCEIGDLLIRLVFVGMDVWTWVWVFRDYGYGVCGCVYVFAVFFFFFNLIGRKINYIILIGCMLK